MYIYGSNFPGVHLRNLGGSAENRNLDNKEFSELVDKPLVSHSHCNIKKSILSRPKSGIYD